MAEPFNSINGYSTGIPPVPVIDGNGNVITNVNTLSGNVSANKVYANSYWYANGDPLQAPAGGNVGELQYNHDDVIDGVAGTFYDGNILILGNVSQVSILGGDNGYFLQTDGTGNLTWAAGGGGGGNGSPGGANTQVQSNDSGVFGGDPGFTYNKITNTLTVENLASGNTIDDTITAAGSLSVTGNIVSLGNIVGNYFIGNGAGLTDITTETANYVRQNTQANITALGNLQYLYIDGETVSLGNIETSGDIIGGNLNAAANIYAGNGTITNKLTVNGNLYVPKPGVVRITGNINTAGSNSINLGTISNIHISGGLNGYFLQTDGLGNLSWGEGGGGGGNGMPAGSNTQVQYNNADNFGASPYFTYDDYTRTVQVAGTLIGNSVQIGAGAYKYSTSLVYFATTNSSAPSQVLYSVPVSDISGVEFEIITTDPTGPSRQFCKINALYYEGSVQFNEYASLFINAVIGNFEIDYNAGNLITPPSLELLVTPNTANPVTYKMLITQYASNGC